MLTEDTMRNALAEQDEIIGWLAEQNKKLAQENEELIAIVNNFFEERSTDGSSIS